MHKSGLDWRAYNYVWNDEQTEAVLAGPEAFDRTFTIGVEAQADPTDIDGLTKIFADSFLCAGGGLAGKVTACVDPIADIWRQTKWDFGAWRFRLTDWSSDFKVDGTVAGLRFQATKCGGFVGTWEFTVTPVAA